MQHGAIFLKSLLGVFLASSTIPALAGQEKTLSYLQSMGVEVFAINQNERLTNLNLKTAITSQGLVYFDEENDVFFVNTKPMVKSGEQLDFADKLFFDAYMSTLTNTIDAGPESPKLTAYVFTDISCEWCSRLHNELDQYISEGIELKFVYYPRNGLDSIEARQMSAISQMENPMEGLNAAFSGRYIAPQPINDTISAHFNAGVGMGVSRTPSIVINGYVFEGYLHAQQMAAMFIRDK